MANGLAGQLAERWVAQDQPWFGGGGFVVKIMHNDFGNRTKRDEFRYHY